MRLGGPCVGVDALGDKILFLVDASNTIPESDSVQFVFGYYAD